MQQPQTRVGIIGAGSIGRAIFDWLRQSGLARVDYLLVADAAKPRDFDPGETLLLDDRDAALDRRADLVIEAAMARNVRDMAPAALAQGDFMAFSCTALADPATEAAIAAAMQASGRRLFVPHGAVLGLDGIADGRSLLERVTITTTKSGKSLGLPEDSDGLVFEGPTRGICAAFPRNVNVHAAVALAGLGFDRTVSRLIARPGLTENIHRIEVQGRGFEWGIDAASPSLGGVTGAYTPLSAIGSVQRVLNRRGLTIV